MAASSIFASTDYKLLVDIDNAASTGCTVSGMPGVDRVITTTVDTSGATPRVTAVTRQDCSGGSLGTAITIDNSGWPAASNATNGVSTIETRIPLAVFGTPLPPSMRIGFVVVNGSQNTTVLTDADGNPILFPGTEPKRRAVGGRALTFEMDGQTGDWAGLSPLVSGDAEQSNGLRILNVYAFVTGEFAYFRFDAQSQSAAPTARNDSYATPLHTPLTVPAPGVLSNDSDPNSRPLTAGQVSAPDRGVLVLNADGSLTYTPDDSGATRETFTYQASNGAQPSNVARVEIRVGQNNHRPNATDKNYSVPQGGALNIAAPGVLENDTDPDGDPLHAILGTSVSHGTLTLNSDGSFTYVNDGVSLADDEFTYFANDGFESSREATVHIHVTQSGSAPHITIPASDQTVCAGSTATFSAAAAGAPPPSLQWSVSTDGGTTFTAIPGATTNPYSFTATLADNGNQYRATFTNVKGSASTTATLTVITTPAVTTQPATQTVQVGSAATFNVAGTYSPTIQWQVSTNGGATFTNIAGATSTTYSFSTTLADNGHQFRAVLTNACGSATSAAAILTVVCPTITVTNPATTTAPAGAAFSQTFTQSGSTGTVTFTTASALPAGLTLASNGTLSGTPTQTGTFPITVTATDSFGCVGTGVVYNLVITCQTITITNPATTTGTVSAPFSQQFTQTGAIGATTFTTASAMPPGLSLSASGLLSGTPTAPGTFPIVVTVTDANGCTGTGATYNLVIGCQTITVTNPATNTGTANTPFSQTFTQTGAIGGATFTTASALPTGLTLAANGTLSGTPTQTGTFPIVVTATDGNGCTGTGATYNLVIACQTITVTNPVANTGTAASAFSQTFTQTGAIGTATFTSASALPAGLTLATAGTLAGTPTQTGTFQIVVMVTDGNGCTGTGATYTLTIGCQTVTVTNPATTTGTANTPFSQTFTQTGAIGTTTFTTASTLPAGLSLASNGTLFGTPLQTGSFPIVVTVADGNGCTGTGAPYTLTIGCQAITVNNPATNTEAIGTEFSVTFTATNAIGATTFTTGSALPAGVTLATDGTLSGISTQLGTFPIVVIATDSNGCTGTGATYNLTIGCQTISVTNPANTTGTVNSPFSEQFTQSGAIGGATFTTASALPGGLTLSTSGLLSGTPTQTGTFNIVVMVTDGNGCTGTGATYSLVIGCQTITVGNPALTTSPAGTPISIDFTQAGAVGGATFTTASALPTGLSLATNGTLSGTPLQGGTFPIVVTVTDGNGCTGTNPPYSLTLTCPTITVTNPGVNTGTAGVAFSQTFTQSGGAGTITFSEVGTLPAGFTFNPSTGVLSGTTSQVGAFPITVTATDQNGCTGTGVQYNLTINCQTVSVTNPGVNTGTVDAAFSQTFTATGILGTATWSETGTLPAGITLNASTGVLSGTPTVNGVFLITVQVTDTNGCFGTSPYTLTINCQTITITNPVTNTGTANTPFLQTFTQSGAHGTATFTTASTLPAGLSLSAAGVLSGTPTQTGTFPIVVVVTDANGCTGSTGATYSLTIGCQVITVNNPATTTGTVSAAFSQTFTASNAIGTTTFGTASALPSGLTLAADGTLAGTPTVPGTFPIVVVATDGNGCTGAGATYNLVIGCQTITVTNPANASGPVNAAFSEQFTQSGAVGGATFSTLSALPAGLSLSGAGLLSGTPTQGGTFPIVVTVTDGNGCTGNGPTYDLTIVCPTITVTNASTDTGTAGVAFSSGAFTQTGGNGTITWSETGTLPTGITLNTSTGVLSGTTTQAGVFPITVTATDSNSCQGTGATYNLTINCQTISITNPATNSVQSGSPLSVTFTASGILGTASWSETGTLPSGITLNSGTGVLAGTSTQQGVYPLTIKVTDSNGCFATSSYTLTVTCPPIAVTRTGGGSFPAGTAGTAYAGQSFTASGGTGPYTFTVTSGTFPPGLTLASDGTISGTPTATGTFLFDVTATDANSCTGSASFSIAINPAANPDTYNNLVNNTEAVVTGFATPPTTPFVSLTGTVIANDLPGGGVAVNAGTFATTQGGSVTIAADGTFQYTPPVTAAPLASDTFNYTITSNTGGTGTPTSATGTATLNLSGRVWYVENNVTNGSGQSQSPFNSLSNFTNGARIGPDTAGDIIFVYTGDGTTTNQNAGVSLLANEQLIGQGLNAAASGFALVVNGNNLVATGTNPQITNATANSDAVVLNDGNSVKGLTITGATRDGIAGNTRNSFTGDTLIIQNNVASGLHFTAMLGAIVLTNTQVTGNLTGLDVNGGIASISLDNTCAITANGGQRSVSIQNRTAGGAGAITVAATIIDGGTGIFVGSNNNGTISFTGSQTLSTTSNAAVTLSTNVGATITFSGILNITTTTGNGFSAAAGGTLNVTGTANVTTGAAGVGVNINGITVGGSGVTFTSVNTTGATTGISLNTVTGTITVSSGTVTGGTTGISGTSFGTLAVGATLNVSAATALNLNTGVVSGTFANVSSTGGTNGVNLIAVTGTWGATGGSLTGAAGSTFNVTGGGAGTISWGSTINQTNAANVVTIAGGNSGTINFSGNVTTSGGSTGISISASSGTYNFTGATSTIAGTGGGILIFTETGTITFGSGYSISAATTSFKIGGTATNTSANITYSGTITNNNNLGVLLDVNSALGMFNGTLLMNGTSLSGSVGTAGGVISIIKNMTGTLTVNNLSLTSSNISFNNTLVAISGTNTAGNFTFNHLTLSAIGSGHTGKGLTMSGGGTLTITATGGASSIDVSSTALDLNGIALGASTIATVNSNGGVNGILLTTVTGGTLTITSGAISAQTSSSFRVSGGSASVTCGATITQNTAGQRAVDIQNATGGTLFFTGVVSSTGAGILLQTNTGTTMRFAGGMTLNTGGSNAFTATGGGTVEVCDENPCNNAATGALNNTLITTTGTALNVANTTIGANNLEFRSISANGAVNGILLDTTGSIGGLKVKGNSAGNCGGSITVQPLGTLSTANAPVTGDCTGGTIQATTGHAVVLTSTSNVSLTRMLIQNAATNFDEISANTISSLTIDHCFITDNAGVSGDRGIEIGDFTTGTAVNGTITISNSTIGPTEHDNIGIGIGSGTSTWNFTNDVLTGSVLDSGMNFEVRNATVTSFLMDGCVVQNQFADGMQINPASGVNATITSATIQNSSFTTNNIHMDLNHDGGSNVTYKVLSNTFQFSTAQAINFFTSTLSTGGVANGRFQSNRIGNAVSFLSGGGAGIRINVNGGAAARVLVDSNIIRQEPDGRGIEIISRNGTGGTDATVTNNTVDTDFVATVQNGGFSLSNIFMQSNCLATCNTLRSNITNNFVPAVAPTGELVAGQLALLRTGLSTNQLVDNPPASVDALSELTSHNTGSVATNGTINLIAGPINTPP
ncbi:MAG TPA: putative Ig domain-containing protein [Thermoanaerobaculia bacterium]|nr:putative Ig domain-containing protein [Thermoanaerobaculia bacterium]